MLYNNINELNNCPSSLRTGKTKKVALFANTSFMDTHAILISFMCFLSVTYTILGKGLSSDVPDLSTTALESLVAHYDGKSGVETDGGSVVSYPG